MNPPPIATVRASDTLIDRYRKAGVWRADTLLDDLSRWRRETPHSLAVLAREAGRDPVRLTFAEYGLFVERFAGALRALGVCRGQVVAIQSPNRWQVAPLVLACARIGAVAAPIMPTIRPRELERVLRRLEAVVCITVDEWDGFAHSAALAGIATRLSALRHRVVIGDRVRDGELDFRLHFQETPWEDELAKEAVAPLDPDSTSLVVFTSGTSGEPKAALHTLNTAYATYSALGSTDGVGPGDVVLTPHSVTHIGGLYFGAFMPLHFGAATVITDAWDPPDALPLFAEAGITWLAAAPVFLSSLIDAMREQSVRLPSVRVVRSGSTTIPAPLFTQVQDVFGLPLGAIWGMTEGANAFTRPIDETVTASGAVGRPGPGVEIDLRTETTVTENRPGRVFARGGSLCLATLGRDTGELNVLTEHGDGWYDTGDLAIPDGQGGIRLMGRAVDRIGSVFMIPANDVESALLGHPAVRDVALVGYPDGHGGELACAVVVPTDPPPALRDLRDYLTALGMTEWYLPSRLELMPALPRNESGKVRKDLLRKDLLHE